MSHISQPAPSTQRPAKHSVGRVLLAFMQSAGIFVCVLAVAVGLAIWGGATAGERERQTRATATTSAEIQAQYDLAMQDIQSGKLAIAAERLRWIIQKDQAFPGASDALHQIESLLDITPTVSPTFAPQTGGNPDDLFAQGQKAYQSQDWAATIRLLQELQATKPDYRADEVKLMLYESLSKLGLNYLRTDRLEEGLLLLEQAEQIKPLDDQTAGERNLARLYLTGRAYVGLNWAVAIKNFEAIYVIAPNYRDVKDQLRKAYLAYADQLVALGGHCDAANLYDLSLQIENKDVIKAKFDAETALCAIPTAVPTPSEGTILPTDATPPTVVPTP